MADFTDADRLAYRTGLSSILKSAGVNVPLTSIALDVTGASILVVAHISVTADDQPAHILLALAELCPYALPWVCPALSSAVGQTVEHIELLIAPPTAPPPKPMRPVAIWPPPPTSPIDGTPGPDALASNGVESSIALVGAGIAAGGVFMLGACCLLLYCLRQQRERSRGKITARYTTAVSKTKHTHSLVEASSTTHAIFQPANHSASAIDINSLMELTECHKSATVTTAPGVANAPLPPPPPSKPPPPVGMPPPPSASYPHGAQPRDGQRRDGQPRVGEHRDEHQSAEKRHGGEPLCEPTGRQPKGIQLQALWAEATLPDLVPGRPFTPFCAVCPPRGKKPKPRKAKSVVGLELGEYETIGCYGEMCPQILVMLWCGIVLGDGIATEGLFRLAGDSKICAAAEASMAKGKLPKDTPPECLAHLIKSFLRHLPNGLFGKLPSDVITECSADAGCERLMNALGTAEHAVLCWLIRVIVEVAACEGNKMDVRNLALVLAPNLFGPPNPGANPMEELMLIKAATTTLMTLVAAAQAGAASRGRNARVADNQPPPPPPPMSAKTTVDDLLSDVDDLGLGLHSYSSV